MSTIRLTVTVSSEGLTPDELHGVAIDALLAEVRVTDDHGFAVVE